MSPKARNGAAAAAVLVLIAGLVLGVGNRTGTFATFIAQDQNQASTFSGSWVAPPTSLGTPSIGGAQNATISFGWTSGASFTMPNSNTNLVGGQQLLIHDNGLSSSCPSSTSWGSPSGYASEGSALGSGTTSTTDNPPNSVTASDYLCYGMKSTSTLATTWSSTSFFSAVQLFVPTAVVFGGNGDGKMDQNDTVTITFNQNVKTSSVPTSVTVCWPGGGTNVLIIGDTFPSGCHNASDSYDIGEVTGITSGGGGQHWQNSTVTFPSANQIKITFGSGGQTNTPTSLSSGTFVAASTVQATNSLGACTSTSAPTCTAGTSGSV